MAASRKLVAVEEHFLTENYLTMLENVKVPKGEEVELAFMRNFPRNTEMRKRFIDGATRLAEMDRAAIDVSVLSLNPPGVQIFDDAAQATALARDTNDALADLIVSDPARLAGLGAVAPQDPSSAADEVKRIMGPLGFGGVLIGSHTHGRYLDEPECEPILAAIEEEDATLYLHPRCPSPQMLEPYRLYGMVAAVWGFQAEAGTHAIRLIMSGVLDRHPKLRIVLGHLGEALPFWLWRLDNIHQKTFAWAGEELGMVKLSLKPSEYIKRNFWITTSGMSDPDVIEYCVNKLGADRIMFAVDYPYEDGRVAAEALERSDLDDEQRQMIAHGNAEKLFRLEN